ncbi:Nidogen-like protein [Dirofilaria immitis]|nr:Nidogen-like protein [Dirofilaria immitis]
MEERVLRSVKLNTVLIECDERINNNNNNNNNDNNRNNNNNPNYNDKNKKHYRYKRQFDTSNTPQIDLNITVPYVFSARLYPFGDIKGDQVLTGSSQIVKLSRSFKFLGKEYDAVNVRRDGAIGLSAIPMKPSKLPSPQPVIAVYWMAAQGGKVHYRESNDSSILNLAEKEVNIQYRYGSTFKPTAVFIVTWENTHEISEPNSDGNSFQLALVISDIGTFAHIVYSKLNTNKNAVAGFSGVDGYYSLPGSGTQDAKLLAEKAILGEECAEICGKTEWGLDCTRECHCDGGAQCNAETGACPGGKCNPGWTGAPICEDDVDECAEKDDLCPREQPDCVNTAGAYLCICYEYDNITNTCKGTLPLNFGKSESIAVSIVPVQPVLASTITVSSIGTTKRLTTTTQLSTQRTSLNDSKTTQFTSLPNKKTSLGIASAKCRCDENAECISGVCKCKSGWTGDGKLCIDINECFGEPSVCGAHALCENSPGSYSCQCNIGYIFDNNGKCIDLDECAEGIVVCSGNKNSTICVNTDGSYECRCAPGYAGNPDSSHGCVGSYECECADGFQRDQYTGQCVDINECKYDPCDKAAVCTNLHGSFRCVCTDGFIGNGVECHETILFPTDNPILEVPARLNAVSDYLMNTPLQLFGRTYRTLYISSNGGISFGEPLPLKLDGNVRFPAFLPLYQHYSFHDGSKVVLKVVDDTTPKDYTILARLSLSIHNKFHQKDFRARSLFIISYDHMLQADTDQENSFQVIIARGDNATFAMYLFEQIESDSGLSGFSSANRSNIGEQGKWLFRVDGVLPLHCPAGTLDPPLCQKECNAGTWGFRCENKCHCRNDIPCDFATGFCSNAQCADGWMGVNCFEDVNECITERHNCSSKATCINEIGTYRCKCSELFEGDGFSCKQVDACYMRYKEKCSINAICDEKSPEGPECICNEGYHGDGLNCLRINAPVEEPITPILNNEITDVPLGIPKSVEIDDDIDETPFLMNNWINEPVDTKSEVKKHRKETNATIRTTTNPPLGKDYSDIGNELYIGGKTIEETDSSSTLFIVTPVALCALWSIIIVIVVAVCCRKKDPVSMAGWRKPPQIMNTYPNHFTAQY